MKRIIVAVSIIGLLALGWVVGCSEEDSWVQGTAEKGSGDLETRVLGFSDFNRVEVGPAFRIEIARSDMFSVSITADDNLIDEIEVSRSGDALVIGLTSGGYDFTTLRAEITMPELYGLELDAATTCTVEGFDSSHDFDATLTAASMVTGDMTVGDAYFNISAASRVDLSGSARDIVVEACAASVADLADFPVNNADVTLTGASQGTVNLDGTLDANLSSASTLEYIGEPAMGDIQASGASTLKKR
jgi:hypothetical protein